MDSGYEDRPVRVRPPVEPTHPLISDRGPRREQSVAEARAGPVLPLGEDLVVVRARPVRHAALLLDRAGLRLPNRALRATARARLSRPLRPDLRGDRASPGAVAAARRDAHPPRAGRQRRRNRADRAARLGNRPKTVDTARPNRE